MLNIQDSKIILKNSTVSGQVPTVAPSNDHTDGSWDSLDIYEGEMMSNVADSKVWMRMNNGIRELLVQRNNSATGDLYYWGGSTWQRVAIGTSGQVLTVSGGVPVWAASTGGGGTSGGVPTTRTITINGNTQDLSADRTYNVGDMLKSVYDTDDDGTVDSAETIRIIVRNSTGSTLTKGQVVYLSGATGNRPNAVLADADTEATSSKTIGLVQANILNNADGYVVVQGTMHDLDTSAFTAGDTLWLSSTAGGMVANTPPAEPAHSVFIGYVARAHPTQGRVVLKIQNGFELNELHGVLISSESNNDILQYETSSGLWKNKQLVEAVADGSTKGIATFTANDFNSVSGVISLDYTNGQSASSVNKGFLTSADWNTFNGKQDTLGFTAVPNTRTINTNSPLSGGGNLTADRTISIQDAVADGTTKGAATFNANDFNSLSGVISLDYTNGQSASAVNKGFLTSADWTTFNQKSGVFMYLMSFAQLNPLDGVIYYGGILGPTTNWGTTAAARRHYFASSIELIAASIMINVQSTIGSGESGTLAIRKNNTTDYTISTGIVMNAANVYLQVTGLSGASFVSGDYFELKFTAPTWATNPSTVTFHVALYFR